MCFETDITTDNLEVKRTPCTSIDVRFDESTQQCVSKRDITTDNFSKNGNRTSEGVSFDESTQQCVSKCDITTDNLEAKRKSCSSKDVSFDENTQQCVSIVDITTDNLEAKRESCTSKDVSFDENTQQCMAKLSEKPIVSDTLCSSLREDNKKLHDKSKKNWLDPHYDRLQTVRYSQQSNHDLIKPFWMRKRHITRTVML